MKTKIGVIIARFHTDELHVGHRALIDEVIKRNDRIVVFLGTRSTPPTSTLPLPYEAREQLVADYLNTKNYDLLRCAIQRLPDHPDNATWSAKLDEELWNVLHFGWRLGDVDVTLYAGRGGFIPCYSGQYKTEELSLGFEDVNATDRRRALGRTVGSTKEWRQGVIWAMHNLWHRRHHTVDVACVRHQGNGTFQLLLCQKTHETAEWRFPGGFVDKGEVPEQAARRELLEETKLIAEDISYIGSYLINDWRIRDAVDVDHMTTLFLAWNSFGSPEPSDDIARLQWFDIDDVFANIDTLMVKEHRVAMTEGLRVHFAKVLKNNPHLTETHAN